jgi:putative ABC transport system permease protein
MRSQKLRSALTLLGVVAGVATVIMMVSFVVGFNNQVTRAFTAFGTHLVQFQKYEPRFGGPEGPPEEQRNRRDLTIEDALALKRLSTLVAAVSPERYKFGDVAVKAGRAEANGPVLLGAAPDYMLANNHFVGDGRFFSDADLQHAARVCVIGTDVADALFPHRDPIDEELTLGARAYRVIGCSRRRVLLRRRNDNFVAIRSPPRRAVPRGQERRGDTIHIATVPKRPQDVRR